MKYDLGGTGGLPTSEKNIAISRVDKPPVPPFYLRDVIFDRLITDDS
jgi:hypothetical protein